MEAIPRRHRLLAMAGLVALGLGLSGCGGGSGGPAAASGGTGDGTGGGMGGMTGDGMGGGKDAAGWLLPGTEKSGPARRRAIAALESLDAAATDRVVLQGSAKALGRIAGLPVAGGAYAALDGSDDLWGDWDDPALTAAIGKAQRINEHDGGRAVETGRQVVGFMTHGYFGVSHATKRFNEGFVSTEGRSLVTAFHAFYAVDDSIAGAPPLRALDLDGARWTGDALGIERGSERAVFGPASLTLTGQPASPGDYAVRLAVTWNDGGSLQLDGTAGGVDGAGRGGFSGSRQSPAGDELWRFGGTFAGTDAGEALGAFRTPDYVGAFGVRRP